MHCRVCHGKKKAILINSIFFKERKQANGNEKTEQNATKARGECPGRSLGVQESVQQQVTHEAISSLATVPTTSSDNASPTVEGNLVE